MYIAQHSLITSKRRNLSRGKILSGPRSSSEDLRSIYSETRSESGIRDIKGVKMLE